MQNNYKTKNNISQKDGKSETISQLARRHLLNENHTTTDEELKNARIEFDDNFDASAEHLSDNSVLAKRKK
ncbi:MAG: hypothetical protein WKG06_18040 [Segetibacter sp.]